MSQILRTYLQLLEKYPWRTTSICTGGLMAAGDLIAQTLVERRQLHDLEFNRTARFFIFGLAFGPLLRGWYGVLDRVTANSASYIAPLQKMVIDQAVFAPCFIAFFISSMTLWKTGSVAAAGDAVRKDYKQVLITNYFLWPAAQVLNFYVVPTRHRVMYVQAVALMWNTYLANKTNQNAKSDMRKTANLNEVTDTEANL